MATFITTIQLSDQGMRNIKETCKRADEFKASASAMGIDITSLYWTLGAIDGVLVFEAPDEQTATAAMLQLGASGNVHTQTSRAFGPSEMQEVVGKLG